MPPALHLYPARPSTPAQYGAIGVAALGFVYCLWSLSRVEVTAAWGRAALDIAGMLACVALAGFAWKIAQRIVHSRDNGEPQLVIDPFGVLIRDDFLWRPYRIAWSKIRAIDTVPNPDGVSIVITGNLGRLGQMVDIATDAQEPAELLASWIAAHRRGPTLH